MSTCKSFCGDCQNGVKTELPEFELLSAESKSIFISSYESGLYAKPEHVSESHTDRVTSSDPTSQTSKCGNACKKTLQTSTGWKGYVVFIILGFTVIISIIGVVFAARNKANATKKFNILQQNTGSNENTYNP